MADGLLNKASIILTPTGYKAGTLYNVAPVVEPYEDFDFARASVASRVNSSGLVEMVGRTLGSELVQNGDFSELGSELVTNGDFSNGTTDWTNASSDTFEVVDGGVGHSTSLHIVVSAVNRGAYQSVFVADKTYYVSLDLKVVSGSVYIGKNTRKLNNQNYNNSDWQTITGYLVAIDDKIRIYGNEASEFYVDNVSVKQVDPNDYWTLGTSWSIGSGVATYDGLSNIKRIYQPVNFVQNKTYKISFDITDTEDDYIDLFFGQNATALIGRTDYAIGSYEFYAKANSTSENLSIYAYNTSYSGGSITNISVQEVIDTNNIPRISYDSNGDNGHILLEPTSTNLVTYSEEFDHSSGYWNTPNTTVETTSITSPDGSNNTYKLFADTGSSTHYLDYDSYSGASSGQTYTFSLFVKSAGSDFVQIASSSGFPARYQNFNLSTGAKASGDISNATIEAYPNGWYRVSVTETTNGTSRRFLIIPALTDMARNASFAGNAQEDGVYIFGAQLEELSYATSYIPTLTGSTVTRATETLTGSGNSTLINSTEGVLYAEIAMLSEDDKASSNQIAISDGTADNRIMIFIDGSGDVKVQLKDNTEVTKTANLTALDQSQGGVNTAAFNKIAIQYKSGENKLFVNGSEITSSSFNDFVFDYSATTLDNLEFGSGGNSNYFRGKCKALAVFNEALSPDELTQLTT